MGRGGAGVVIWLIGLSGAGKTTIGRHVFELLKAREPNTVLADGDEIRRIFKHDGHPDAYSVDGRAANAERIAELCAWLDRQRVHVICCCLSIFEQTRRWNRQTYSKYFEVYVSVPFDTLLQRDTKDLYAPAMRGERRNVVGVDIPFVPPASPDMVVDNGPQDVDHRAIAREILERAEMSR
jgi:cytidine diphosphoramidate kinase